MVLTLIRDRNEVSGGTKMFKLTFTLAVALYAGFVIWGQPSDALTTELSTRDVAAAIPTDARFDRPVIIANGSSRMANAVVTRAAVIDTVVPDAATIAASAPAPGAFGTEPRLIGEPLVVSLVRPDTPASADALQIAAAAVTTSTEGLLQVNGSRVNLRSGPSTSNAVVDSLVGGTLAEPLGNVVDGWVEIRDVASGLTGYMSAQFLDPA